jgi:hypothetical protein
MSGSQPLWVVEARAHRAFDMAVRLMRQGDKETATTWLLEWCDLHDRVKALKAEEEAASKRRRKQFALAAQIGRWQSEQNEEVTGS